jgi:hypothetical protein
VSKRSTAGVSCTLALIASLALARVHPFGDAGLYAASDGKVAIALTTHMPQDVRAILIAKCADCHSNQTRAPFYGHFAPVSWLMERDIVEARKAMNLSLWTGYSIDQQQTYAAKMAQEIKSHDMPPDSVPRNPLGCEATTDTDLATVSAWAHGMQTATGEFGGQQDQAMQHAGRRSLRCAARAAIRSTRTNRDQRCKASMAALQAQRLAMLTPTR